MLGGKVDAAMMRLLDGLIAIPRLPVSIVILVFLGLRAQNIQSVVLALAIVNWMITARLVRGEVVLLKKQDYVRAAQAVGAASSRAGTSFPTPSGSCSWRSSSSSRR
jgi:oligopeptide transport system permease protein